MVSNWHPLLLCTLFVASFSKENDQHKAQKNTISCHKVCSMEAINEDHCVPKLFCGGCADCSFTARTKTSRIQDQESYVEKGGYEALGTEEKGEILVNDNALQLPHEVKPIIQVNNNSSCPTDSNILCGENSSCKGLMSFLLELCSGDDSTSDCSSECVLLLSQIKLNAFESSTPLECFSWLNNMMKMCEETEVPPPAIQNQNSCPAPDGWLRDIHAGEVEILDCPKVYSSAKGGKIIRYCLLSGADVVNDNNCILPGINETMSQNVETENDKNKLSKGGKGESILSSEDNLQKIIEGADTANTMLTGALDIISDYNDAFEITKYAGTLARASAALGVIGIALSIVTAFLPQPDSPELVYMKEQFKIVNEKLDRIENSIENLKHELKAEFDRQTFGRFQAHMASCTILWDHFQEEPSEERHEVFESRCCGTSTSPSNYLFWLHSNVDRILTNIIKAEKHTMASFLSRSKGFLSTASFAGFYATACLPTGDIDEYGDMIASISNHYLTMINSLPTQYLQNQLHKDVESVVSSSSSTEACAINLQKKVKQRMRGWKNDQVRRVYALCWDKTWGWDQHARSTYGASENYGAYAMLRVKVNSEEKYSVTVDWTTQTLQMTKSDAIRHAILEYFRAAKGRSLGRQNDSSGISAIEEVIGRYINVRNIVYVRFGNGLRGRGDGGVMKFENFDPYEFYDYDQLYSCGFFKYCNRKIYGSESYSIVYSWW